MVAIFGQSYDIIKQNCAHTSTWQSVTRSIAHLSLMDICLEDIPSDSASPDSVGDSSSPERTLCLFRSSLGSGSRDWDLTSAWGKPWGLGGVCGGTCGLGWVWGGVCGNGLGRSCTNRWGFCWVCGDWVKGLGYVGGGWGGCEYCCGWTSDEGLGKVGGGCWMKGLGRVLGGWGWGPLEMWDTVLDETLAISGLSAVEWSGTSRRNTYNCWYIDTISEIMSSSLWPE